MLEFRVADRTSKCTLLVDFLNSTMAPFESSNSNGSLSSLPNDTPKEVEVDTGFDGDSKLELFDCTSHLPKFVKIHYEGKNRKTRMINFQST